MTELLEVGTIAKAHGLRGEVIVALSSDRTERLDAGSVLHDGTGSLVVVDAHRHQHRWRVRFEGVDSREAADALRGRTLSAEPLDDPDVWFVHELVGVPVVLGDGSAVGTCVAVLDNPAHDLLELDSGVLVPMPFVTDVADVITIDPPEGLLDLHEQDDDRP